MSVMVSACSPNEAIEKLKAAILSCCCEPGTACLCQCSTEYMLLPNTINIEFTEWDTCTFFDCAWLVETLGVIVDVPPFDNCDVFKDPSYLPGGAGFNSAFGLSSSITAGSWDACCTIGEGSYIIPVDTNISWPWDEGAEAPGQCATTDPPELPVWVRPTGWEACLASLPTCYPINHPYCFNTSLACATVTVRFPDLPNPGDIMDITWTGDRYEAVSIEFTVDTTGGQCDMNAFAQVVTEWNWNATPEQQELLPLGIGNFCTVRRAGYGPSLSAAWDPFCATESPCFSCPTASTFSTSSATVTALAPCAADMVIDCETNTIQGSNDYTGCYILIECDLIPKPTGP